jgi:uncharacterized membrane protein YfhO
LSFYVFVQRHLKIEPIPSLLFSTAYALSGTIIYNADNLQWLDGMIWLPILILGIERMREKGRCAYLPFVIAVLIISNFYAAVLCAPFCVIYVIYVIFRSKHEEFTEKRGIFFLKILLSALAGLGMAAFIVIPILFTLRNDMNLVGQSFPSLGLTANPLLTLEELFFARKGYISTEGVPKIYSSVLVIILLPFFFFAKGITRRKKIAAAAVVGFMFLVLHVSWLNFVFHGLDEIGWFRFRYAFVISFFLLALAAEGFREGNFRFSEHQKFFLSFITILILTYLGPIVLFGLSDSKPVSVVIFFLNLALFIVYIAFLESKKNMHIALCAVLFLELFLNTSYIQHNIDAFAQYSDHNNWKLRTGEIETILKNNSVREEENRIAIRMDTLTMNDMALFGVSGIEFYSSAASLKTASALYNMGYIQNIGGSFEISDNGGTLLSDALLSIEGEIVEDSPLGNSKYRPSVFPSRHLLIRKSQYAPIYIQHAVVLPQAFTVNEKITEFNADSAAVKGPIAYTDELVSHMLGREVQTTDALTPVYGSVNAAIYNHEEWMVYVSEDPFEYSSITLDVMGQGEHVPMYLYSDLIWQEDSLTETKIDISYYIENEGSSFCLKVYDATESEFLIPIGAYKEGSTVRVNIPFIGCMPAFSSLEVFAQSEALVSQITAPLMENPVDFRWTGSSSFQISTHNDSEEIVFISIPFDGGWSAECKGEPQEILNLAGGFMGIRVPEGEQEIEFSFIPGGLCAGIAVSLSFVFLTAGWLLIRRFRPFDFGKNRKNSRKT